MTDTTITRLLIAPVTRRSALRGASSVALGALLLARPVPGALAQAEPLLSWNEGPAKQALLDFIARVTDEAGADFVPVAERIATFDNDGTLWCEKPLYVQLCFVLDRVRALAPEHPEWQTEQPDAAILNDDQAALSKLSEHDIEALMAATHAGMTTAEFAQIAAEWLATALHPRFQRLFTECVYQPQLELLDYLRVNGFQTWIVSGGGIEFMRAIPEVVYGLPPEQIIGSSGKLQFALRDGQPVFDKLAEVSDIDNNAGKPININLHIGRRPLLAFGNSDGDKEMLQYTQPGDDAGPRLGLLVHHDDAEREYAYDSNFSAALMTEAAERGWILVSMKDDWGEVFPSRGLIFGSVNPP
jgi:hypothetical protein